MAKIVFPSENAVGSIDATSTQVLREHVLTLYARACQPSPLKSFIFTGFEVYNNTGANSVRVEYGGGGPNGFGHYAMINGSMISFDADINLTGLTNNTHFIYAQLTRDGNLATTWELVSNTTGVSPTYSVCLACVVVAGGVAGTPQNAKHSPGYATGSYVGNNASSRLIFTGVEAKEIQLYGGYHDTGTPHGPEYTVIHKPDIPGWDWGVLGTHTAWDANGFIVGMDTGNEGFNQTGFTYYYVIKA